MFFLHCIHCHLPAADSGLQIPNVLDRSVQTWISIVHELIDPIFDICHLLVEMSESAVKVGQELALAEVLLEEGLHEGLVVSVLELAEPAAEVLDLLNLLVCHLHGSLDQVDLLLVLAYSLLQLLLDDVIGAFNLASELLCQPSQLLLEGACLKFF